jgi:hypothetical protein
VALNFISLIGSSKALAPDFLMPNFELMLVTSSGQLEKPTEFISSHWHPTAGGAGFKLIIMITGWVA